MSRFIVAGILGLALTGCAQTKTNVSKHGPPPEPVAITPVPSIYESINRGTGPKSVQQKSLKESADPRWAGRSGGPGTRDPFTARTMASAAKPMGNSRPRVLATPGAGDPIATAGASAADPRSLDGLVVNSPAPASSPGREPVAEQAAVAGSEPIDSPGPGSATSPIISANGLMPISEPPADPGVAPAGADHPGTEPDAAGLATPTLKDAPPKETAGPEAASPAGDPLLGPNPNLMPIQAGLPDVSATRIDEPSSKDAASPSPAPDETPKGSTPDLGDPTKDAKPPGTDVSSQSPSAPSVPASDPLLGPNPVLMPTPDAAEGKNPAEGSADKATPDEKPKEATASAEPVAPSVAAPELSAANSPSPGDDPAKIAGPTDPPSGQGDADSLAKPPIVDPETPAQPAGDNPAKPVAGQSGPADSADDDSLPDTVPIVGTAKDENGEEFGLPELPPIIITPGQQPPSVPAKPAADPGLGTPDRKDAAPSPPLDEKPAGSPSTMNQDFQPDAAVANQAPPADAALRQVTASSTEVKTPPMSRNVKEASRAAAGVGEEVITLNDLVAAVREFRKKHPSQQQPSKEELNMMGKGILLMLIERSLLTQEAKRVLKNPKMLEQLMSFAEKSWTEEELPPLTRKYFAANVYELKEKMAADNRSLDAIHESYRQDFLAQAFLQQKIGSKLKVDLPEMLKYYEDHKNDRENHRPASITWREILVETSKYPDPQEARAKAQRLAERLRKGEKFATLAQAESDGPNLTKSAGGLMETTPGSYGVASVNQAIETLPIGKVSEILEGPNSLHIVVVEKRRAAGPASFAEIQDQIRVAIHSEKVQKERVALISKLRQNTVVWTIFDNTASDPNR